MAISKITTNALDVITSVDSGASNLSLKTAGNTALTIDTSGSVGVGTISPAAKLQVVGGTILQNSGGSGTYGTLLNYYSGGGDVNMVIGTSGSGYVYQSVVTNHALVFGTNNVERMRIDANGNIGIVSSPNAWATSKALQLNTSTALWNYGSTNTYLSNNEYFNGTNRIFIANGWVTEYQQAAGNHIWATSSVSGTAGGTVTSNEYMRIDSSGNVGIGTNGPPSKLSVYGPSVEQRFYNTNGTSNDSHSVLIRALGTYWNSMTFDASQLIFNAYGTERMRVDTVGNVSLSTGNLVLPSGKGISFAANPNASGATSEILDDYEHGTWAPSSVTNQAGTAVTWYNNGCTYTKIGRLVFLKYRVQIASSSGTEIRIYGIPFACSDPDSGQGTGLATRVSTNVTVVTNTDHIWIQGINNYEYNYGMAIYQV